MQLAPILLFVYNRPSHTRQTIEALLSNPLAKESEIFIYSDAPKSQEAQEKVQEVREYIHSIAGFKNITIIERERNFGLAENIIDGVTTIIDQYDKAIVLEDDLLVSPFFLEYMNTNLELYKDDKEVACITAFNFPLSYPTDFKDNTFFIKGADCWTWATWKRAWDKFERDGKKLLSQIQDKNLQKEFDINDSYPYTKMLQSQIEGKNNSWAIRWYASAFLENMLCLYPKESLVENIGYDGTHFKNAQKDDFFGQISKNYTAPSKIPLQENPITKHLLCLFFKTQNSLWHRIIKKLKRIFQ
ncbi:glycosyltransferase [Helicobacter brantae]|uniref:alpha-1,3-mannosyl-glycoprotein 2-beta-N-acetylglucosaminyltransferase n=1 Tax=Helicobacter brantae TaxID=375927 RepID=A0A3D8J3T2_9HELI|nr:glycosyltransferase [Helicobacter brantae]RDU72138.1 glycosyl transferase [Helicobacter brantae]